MLFCDSNSSLFDHESPPLTAYPMIENYDASIIVTGNLLRYTSILSQFTFMMRWVPLRQKNCGLSGLMSTFVRWCVKIGR